MQLKLHFISLLLLLCQSLSSQLCPTCHTEIVFNVNSQHWEDPNGIIYDGHAIYTPDKIGLWTFFELDSLGDRHDLFTSYVDCIDESLIRSSDSPHLNITLFPNPGTNELNIKHNLSKLNIEVFNLSGQRVFKKSIIQTSPNQSKLDISQYEKGYYILFISTPSDSFFKSFVKI